ncbi:unnamed protein product [Calypogeia fissa]
MTSIVTNRICSLNLVNSSILSSSASALWTRQLSLFVVSCRRRRQHSIATSTTSCCCEVLNSTTTTTTTISTDLLKRKKPEKQSPKLMREVFAELELPAIQEMVGGVRVRQHVNPLKASLVAPLAPVKWEAVFADCTLPLMVDIGCGPGRLLMVLAKRSAGTQNFLGLDVRERLVDRAKLWAEELNLSGNVHFVTANATVSFRSLLATYPGPLAYVSILCPDPHFKRKHRKRRIVQKELVDAIVHYLKPGGEICVQSDVKDVALEMRTEFDEQLESSLQVVAGDGDTPVKRDSEGWVEVNPLGVPSEREAFVEANGGRVYRAVYRRI